MQRIPAPTAFHIGSQRLLFVESRHDIAGVGHQEIGFADGGNIGIILKYPNAHAFVFCQQLQNFQPCEIDIVIFAGRDERDLDFLLSLARHDSLNIERAW